MAALNLKEMKKPDDLVIFDVYPDAVSAHIAKGVLNTNGIECMITNELMSGILPLSNLPVGGANLMVFRKDLDRAREIMAANDSDGAEVGKCE